ncbi:IS4 family transposase [Rhodoferax sp.]|uniref:IS4 family transposase n=1 Tax=Rhodoferax sp. TaxID=50421 RepID=UPI002ACEA8B3|nr:IS4 family transposase [Rhodoferax sp.]MDZ7921792.1 IS4 family transposase [Rhodoferax sp.]
MNTGRTVFAQLLGVVPFSHFEHLVDKYQSNRWTREFTAWSHFICMAYAQLTRREGLRDLIACLNSQSTKLYHVGLRQRVSRSTLADVNERRDSALFEALGQRLTEMALALYQDHDIGLGLKEPLYAMDSTTIDLCLSLFPWADFRSTKAGIKAHTVIDLRGSIPVMLTITTGKVSDVGLLDSLTLPKGSIVVLDRGYVDFARLYMLVQRECSFVVRAKDNLSFNCVHANPPDTKVGVYSDQTITLTGERSKKGYPEPLRRVRFYDAVSCLELVFLTNRLDLPALTIAAIYKQRWQVELFFKWLKQNLSVKHFFGNSLNAVKSQIWIAVCTYLMALIAHKPFQSQISLRNFLHLVEVNMFEKISLSRLVSNALDADEIEQVQRQAELF